MKHLKLFENLNTLPDLDELTSQSEKLSSTLTNMYNDYIIFLDKTHDIGYEVDVCVEWTSFAVIEFKKGGILKTSYGDELEFNDLLIESKINIINELLLIIRNSYKYQKHVIKNEPNRINTILDILHDKIKKEFPHLVSGNDLRLI